MAGGRRGRRPARAEPRDRLDVRRRARRAGARQWTGAAGAGADRCRTCGIGGAGGGCGGVGAGDGSRDAVVAGGRAVRRHRCASIVPLAAPASTHAWRPDGACFMVADDIDGAWLGPDAGAGADTSVSVRHSSARDHRDRLDGHGARRRQRAHCRHARGHGCDRCGSLSRHRSKVAERHGPGSSK